MSDRSEHAPGFRLDLEQQRTRARELHRAARAGDAAARERFRRHHPAGEAMAAARLATARLAEAQLVIARELGVPSWPRLKAHILAMQAARSQIETGVIVPDGDLATLHLRCGSDLRERLRHAGFAGDYLEYSDPLCQGPVVAGEDWLERRAAFLEAAYGAADMLARLRQAEAALHAAAVRYRRVVLWFEHDSYDQLILARCLAAFAPAAPLVLELIAVDHYPGGARFIGLGQLPPEALRLLWASRRAVTAMQVASGTAVWHMLRAADPRPLAAAAASGLAGLPMMGPALLRHCRELPGLSDGLGLTGRLVLQLLDEAPRSMGRVFAALTSERDPLPWLGDAMLRHILESMERARPAVFTRDGGTWPQAVLSITDLGRAVLAGEVDFLSLAPPERWVGGVRVVPGAPCWRWDAAQGLPRLA
jgi:hypothetical protein